MEQILPKGISRHLKDRKVIGNIHCGFSKGRDHAWPTSFLLWWNDWIHGWGEGNFVINLSLRQGFWCILVGSLGENLCCFVQRVAVEFKHSLCCDCPWESVLGPITIEQFHQSSGWWDGQTPQTCRWHQVDNWEGTAAVRKDLDNLKEKVDWNFKVKQTQTSSPAPGLE